MAPSANNSANVNRILGGPAHPSSSASPATTTKKNIPDTCVSGDKYHPKYCCPGGVGLIYTRIGGAKYRV